MSNQVLSAMVAIFVGLGLAAVLFIPFVYLNYRRNGRLTFMRTLLWVGFLIYAMALWTYTLLPLPDPREIDCVPVQLRPFQFLADIRTFDTSGPGALVHNPAVQQLAFNILLFLPLGVFLRWQWGRGILWSTAAGFLISLLIETTQLTGVWGIYPCAYRLFDVDDLMANTAGALLGGVAAAALAQLRRLANRSAQRDPQSSGSPAPRIVSARRRILGGLCDLIIMVPFAFAVSVVSNLLLTALHAGDTQVSDVSAALSTWIPVATTAAFVFLTGRTPGDHAVAIRFAPTGAPALTGTPVLTGTPEVPGEAPAASTPLPRLALRWLGGIGGYQLLSALNGVDGVGALGALGGVLSLSFLLVSAVLILTTADRRGLPGILSRTRPVDDSLAARG